MFCKKCGNEVRDDDTFCPKCGERLNEVSSNASVEPTTTKKGNGMAIAGFVCSFFIPILGWVFGGIGLKRSGERDGKGKGFSIAAIVIATVMFIIGVVY